MTSKKTTTPEPKERADNVKQCDALGILSIVFAVLARIPLIGRFFFAAALVLAIISIVQGKKKAICGLVGLGLTIAMLIFKVIVIVGFIGTGSKMIKKGMNMAFEEMPHIIAKEQLPGTIKYLEEYKKEYDKYPEKLADLAKIDDDAIEMTIDPMGITDIMSMAFVEKEVSEENALELMPQFYYKKLDEGYYLFSKGKDQEAYTDDDIMPDMSRVMSDVGLQLP